jgi:hypothetical protein
VRELDAKGPQLLQTFAAILDKLVVCLNTFCGLLFKEELGVFIGRYVSGVSANQGVVFLVVEGMGCIANK